MMTITVVSPSAAGNFVAWEGTGSAPTASVLNWNNPGDIAANTTVIPFNVGRGTTSRDFAIFYNGPSGQAQAVVDVVGYFVENTATALDCLNVTAFSSTTTVTNGAQSGFLYSLSCTTGYTSTGGGCYSGSNSVYMMAAGNSSDDVSYFCMWRNLSGADASVTSWNRCCRVPGR